MVPPYPDVLAWVRRHRRLVVATVAISVLAAAFLVLGSEVMEDETATLDHRILLALRTEDGAPIGPPWFAATIINLSALGSGAVATLAVVFAAIFLVAARRHADAALVAICGLGSWAVMAAFKAIHARPRPSVVTALAEVGGYSFPSGHTLAATAVYLTLGVVIATGLPQRRLQVCVLVMAGILALLVGVTRVYIGVHYPTDVLGGWLVGGAWALLCGVVASLLRRLLTAPSHRRSRSEGPRRGTPTRHPRRAPR